MVERGEGPKFPIGAPDEIKAAPDFSAGGDFSDAEQGSTAPTPEVPENRPIPTLPALEQSADSTGLLTAKRAEIFSVSDIGNAIPTQEIIEGIFKDGAEEHE